MPKGVYVHTPEHMEKIAALHRGTCLSEEHKEKISHSLKGNHTHPGVCWSEERRQKHSETMQGRKFSEEHRKKISDAKKKYFQEHPERILRGEEHPCHGTHASDETRLKLRGKRERISGPNNPRWNGGTSFGEYCPKFNRRLKEEIREKFGRKCFLCPKTEKENGKKLDIHHVDYNKGQGCGQKWNLIPLCHRCHTKTNSTRYYYFNLLANYWAMNSEINWSVPCPIMIYL